MENFKAHCGHRHAIFPGHANSDLKEYFLQCVLPWSSRQILCNYNINPCSHLRTTGKHDVKYCARPFSFAIAKDCQAKIFATKYLQPSERGHLPSVQNEIPPATLAYDL